MATPRRSGKAFRGLSADSSGSDLLNKNPFAASFRPVIEFTVGGDEKKTRDSTMSTWTAPDPQITVDELTGPRLRDALARGARLLDTRDPETFAAGHLRGAVVMDTHRPDTACSDGAVRYRVDTPG
jgi:hypothetical protein